MKNEDPAILKSVFLARIEELDESPDVEFVAQRLARLSWQPELLAPVKDFSRISADRLRDELLRFLDLSDREVVEETGVVAMEAEKIRLTQASMLVNAAELLWRLRADDPEAWDHIAELYDDD